jgi:hypothetical protein
MRACKKPTRANTFFRRGSIGLTPLCNVLQDLRTDGIDASRPATSKLSNC